MALFCLEATGWLIGVSGVSTGKLRGMIRARHTIKKQLSIKGIGVPSNNLLIILAKIAAITVEILPLMLEAKPQCAP